jgi:hypothetical protein
MIAINAFDVVSRIGLSKQMSPLPAPARGNLLVMAITMDLNRSLFQIKSWQPTIGHLHKGSW